MAFPVIFPCGFVIYRVDFWTDKLISGYTTLKLGNIFAFHWEGRRVRTAGNVVSIDGIIRIFETGSCIQGYVSFGKMPVSTKGITRKKIFIKLHGIKSSISQKNLWID